MTDIRIKEHSSCNLKSFIETMEYLKEKIVKLVQEDDGSDITLEIFMEISK